MGLVRGNLEMKIWIHLYFNSKYARKGYSVNIEDKSLSNFSNLPLMELGKGEYNASLLDWTNEGQDEEFDFVLDFMHLMEFDDSNSERDNLKHLRGACTRLSMTNPDNYVFRLLRAFAVLVLEEQNLTLKRTAVVLTVEGDLPDLEDEDEFIEITSETDEEDVEELQLLARFYREEKEFAVYAPLDPFFILARMDANNQPRLLSPEELEKLQPLLAEIEDQLFDDLDSN